MSDIAVDAWQAAMRAGNFRRAWQINETDLQRRTVEGYVRHSGPRHCQHIWTGGAFQDKRVLVRCYHGLGDTIQFVRLAQLLRAQAREVVFWCQPELVNLLSGVAGIDRLLPLTDGTPETEFDIDIEIMELAFALRLTPEMLPAPPYLFVSRESSRPPRCAAQHEITIGLAWRAGGWDDRRSIEESALAPLARVPNARFYSLQMDTDGYALPIPIERIDVSSIDRLAETIAGLDLVICVDTLAAHLAGALGSRVWTLLIDDCDWRWPKEARASFWYPDMKLFRQSRPGDWSEVIERVASELCMATRDAAPQDRD